MSALHRLYLLGRQKHGGWGRLIQQKVKKEVEMCQVRQRKILKGGVQEHSVLA